ECVPKKASEHLHTPVLLDVVNDFIAARWRLLASQKYLAHEGATPNVISLNAFLACSVLMSGVAEVEVEHGEQEVPELRPARERAEFYFVHALAVKALQRMKYLLSLRRPRSREMVVGGALGNRADK